MNKEFEPARRVPLQPKALAEPEKADFAHGVQRHNAVLQHKLVRQRRHGGDLVGLAIYAALVRHQALLAPPPLVLHALRERSLDGARATWRGGGVAIAGRGVRAGERPNLAHVLADAQPERVVGGIVVAAEAGMRARLQEQPAARRQVEAERPRPSQRQGPSMGM